MKKWSFIQKNIPYAMEGNLSIIQRNEEMNSKLADALITKIDGEEDLEKNIVETLFCSLCNHVVISKTITCQILPKYNLQKL